MSGFYKNLRNLRLGAFKATSPRSKLEPPAFKAAAQGSETSKISDVNERPGRGPTGPP